MIKFHLIVYTKNCVALINMTLLLNLTEKPKLQHGKNYTLLHKRL